MRLCITALIFLTCVDLFRSLLLPNSNPSDNSQQATAQDLSQIIRSVYIVSNQYNSEEILTSSWIPSLLQLVKELQSVQIRVYVSIYESGSVDGTKEVLSGLKGSLEKLRIDHDIRLDDESHASAIEKALRTPAGWVDTRYGKELRRVAFLADVRNRALEPLDSLTQAGVEFDRILYLNDVVFSVCLYGSDVMTATLAFITNHLLPGPGCNGTPEHKERQLCCSMRIRFYESAMEPCQRSCNPSSLRHVRRLRHARLQR